MGVALAEPHSPWLAVRQIRISLRQAIAEGRPNIEIRIHPSFAEQLRRIRGELPATFDGYPLIEVCVNDPSVVQWSTGKGPCGCVVILPFR